MEDILSLTGKRWIVPEDHHALLHPDQLVIQLLQKRGIDPRRDASDLSSPKIFPDMETVATRIGNAISNEEAVGIFGDYDCDGVTSAAIVARFFLRHNLEPTVRLPHRVRDGYGLMPGIVDEFARKGVRLIITTDNGITSFEAAKRAKKCGIDLIVTDHHSPRESLPDVFAILHPALCDAYPLPHPSGAGVALQLVRALEGTHWDDMDTDFALAMMGTIADLVPLTGENRRLVQKGLASLAFLPEDSPIAQFVLQSGSQRGAVRSTDIAFRLAPRINAAGRMDDPVVALEALLSGGESLSVLTRLNEQRQSLTEKLYDEALGQLREPLPALITASSHQFTAGTVGLLAGRLTEDFGRPSLVATVQGDRCTASLRSPPVYNITEGLQKCSTLLSSFGGHAQAAGCSFPLQNLDAICQQLEKDISDKTDPLELSPSLTVDAVIDPKMISQEFCKRLELLEPFGQENPEPLFILKAARIGDARRVGDSGKHLQGRICGTKMIGFGLGAFDKEISRPLDLVCRLSMNQWNGKTEPQLQVVDMRHCSVLTKVD